jgi:uncharacterized HAD superfamily protein
VKKLVIAVDCDDVLADNAAGFVAFSNSMWGTRLSPEDYDEHWAKIWQVDSDETERRAREFHNSSVFSTYKPVDQALSSLRRLAKNHQLCIVTSRRTEVRGDTVAWIYEHYPGIFADDAIHFAGIWDTITKDSITRDKSGVVASINADVLVDDQLKHCIAVAKSGRQAILFGDYTWNQAKVLQQGVVRCIDWLAVETEIERIANS